LYFSWIKQYVNIQFIIIHERIWCLWVQLVTPDNWLLTSTSLAVPVALFFSSIKFVTLWCFCFIILLYRNLIIWGCFSTFQKLSIFSLLIRVFDCGRRSTEHYTYNDTHLPHFSCKMRILFIIILVFVNKNILLNDNKLRIHYLYLNDI